MAMRNKIGTLVLTAGLILPVAGLAEETEPLGYLDELPPLLDRDAFFGDAEISSPQISPDGDRMTFIRPYKGVRNIWVKDIDEPFDAARPLTADERPVPGYFWSQDSKYVLYVQDKGGDENFHVYAVDPAAESGADTGVPPARDLTPLDGVRATIYAVPKATPERMLIGLNDRDPALHDVYSLEIASGELELLIENDSNVAGWVPDLEGQVRLAVRQTPEGGNETLEVKDGRLGDVLYECSWEESCGPLRFHPDGDRVYFQSNKGEDVNLTSLYLMDAESGELTLIESDPEGQVDFGSAFFSNATDELIGTVYIGDKPRIYPQNDRFARALEYLRGELPEGEISFAPQTSDDRLVLVRLFRDVDPGTVYLFDWENQTIEKLYATRPEIPVGEMAEMQPVRYQARDGLEIPAYLTLPKGVPPENLAVVTLIHGGPWARDTWGYRSTVQFLANRGYAVLQPNFRASTGYGKAFLNAGNNEWGDAMQDDITDGVAWLVEQGIADPARVCIMGGSYGGYATLAGMTFTPDVYACGVDIVGPSNLITLLNSIPPYWGPIRKIFTLRMGDAETDDGRAQLQRQSPLNHVDEIRRPLLVIQGANDPRVKQAEADQIVAAMREAELPVEYIVAPDEGHGFRGRVNRLAMYARVEAFLAGHLGGRFQDSMDEDVAERLAAITVDVESVEKPAAAGELDAARTLPLPVVDGDAVATGEFVFTSSLEMQGQEMEIGSTRRLRLTERDGRELLEIETLIDGPMGDGESLTLLDASSLRPVESRAVQGPVTVEMTYAAREVTGNISASGQDIPVEIELEAPVFGDGTALETALTGLPLREGYRTSLRAVEVGMQQRVRVFNISVEDTESVEVPAGTFDTWRVRMDALDGEGGDQTLWISAEPPRTVVKSEGHLPPQMGGAAFTTVLTAVNEG